MKDNISDLLTRIRNGQKSFLIEVPLFWPTPKICINILKILQKEGFIRGFRKDFINEKKCIIVLLKYTEFQNPLIKKIVRISKPGKRLFVKAKTIWKVNHGKGIFILSSTKGLITDWEARAVGLGGEILCYIE